MDCTRDPSLCDHSSSCGARGGLADVADAIHSQMNGMTLSDLAGQESVTTPFAFDRFGVSSQRLAERPLTLDEPGCQHV